MARSGAASHLPATDTLSSPGLHRAPRNEKAAVHARFVGGQVQRVNIASSSFKRHGHRHRDCRNACLPRHCAPSARRASSRIEGAFGRAMNAVALFGWGRAGLGLPRSGSSARATCYFCCVAVSPLMAQSGHPDMSAYLSAFGELRKFTRRSPRLMDTSPHGYRAALACCLSLASEILPSGSTSTATPKARPQ